MILQPVPVPGHRVRLQESTVQWILIEVDCACALLRVQERGQWPGCFAVLSAVDKDGQ